LIWSFFVISRSVSLYLYLAIGMEKASQSHVFKLLKKPVAVAVKIVRELMWAGDEKQSVPG
jgi:hypothetical protein